MAKRKNVIAPNDDRDIVAMELVKKQGAEKQLAAQEAIAAVGFDLKEYELFTYIQMGRNVFTLHATTGIVGGKLLKAIKKNEPHGTFLDALKEIGIHPRRAQRYIHVAERFGKYDNLSHLNNSVLAVLEDFSDPELEKLDAGEEVKGLTLDAIDSMTAAEVRDKYRAAGKKLERLKAAHEKEVEKLNEIIDDLKIQAENTVPLTEKEKAEKAIGSELEELRRELFAALNQTRFHLGECLKIIDTAQKIEGVTYPMLEKWAEEEYAELAGFGPMFEELDDALRYVTPDKGKDNGTSF